MMGLRYDEVVKMLVEVMQNRCETFLYRRSFHE